MPVNADHRKLVVSSLLEGRYNRLLDIGCGPLTVNYPYAGSARHVICLDWKLQKFGSLAPNIECLEGDFTTAELGTQFNAIIAADVFEHISIEKERSFAEKCVRALEPGGHLIVSVPHRGTFSFLDPYAVKPVVHRIFWKLGLYASVHNGTCDIRKGHKHYVLDELERTFYPLVVDRIRYYGFLFDPLLSWATALSEKSHLPPSKLRWLEDRCRKEFYSDYGTRSFNIAIRFLKK